MSVPEEWIEIDTDKKFLVTNAKFDGFALFKDEEGTLKSWNLFSEGTLKRYKFNRLISPTADSRWHWKIADRVSGSKPLFK